MCKLKAKAGKIVESCSNFNKQKKVSVLKLTHPHPLLVAGVPATPQKSPVVTSND